MTKVGGLWVSGEELASGTVIGCVSPGPPQLLSSVTELSE